MKSFLFSLVLAGSIAQAAIAPRNLADAMQIMNDKLRSIAAQMNNPGMNSQSAVLADEFVEAASAARELIPDTIKSLPAAEQGPKIARYQSLIDQTVEQGKRLGQAFRSNDNAGAVAVMTELRNTRNSGHSEFRP